jgi:hypothetical protein
VATPANGQTNQSWNITHHWLTVTQSVSAAATVTLDMYNIEAFTITATNASFGDLTVGNLSYTGTVSFLDTGSVRKTGATMTAPLTSTAFYGSFFGDGAGITGIVATVNALDDVGNVGVAGASSGDVLQFDGAAWTNGTVGGGFTLWAESTGTATQAGSFLYPTNNLSPLGGLFIGTNGSISVGFPDGSLGGDARGNYALDLQLDRSASTHVASSQRSMLLGSYRSTISAGVGSMIIGGDTIGDTISGGGVANMIIGGGGSATISSSGGGNGIMAGRLNSTIGGSSANTLLLANYGSTIAGAAFEAAMIASESSFITLTNNAWITSAFMAGSGYSRILSLGTDRTRNSSIISGWGTTNAGKGSVVAGYYITNTNDGNFAYASFDSGATRWTPVKSNTATFRVPGGFGIGTNNPQEQLHVSGRIQIDGLKIYASSTNLFITDGATFTGRVDLIF